MQHRAALSLIVALLIGLMIWGHAIDWLPWSEDCSANPSCYPAIGETWQAAVVGHQYLLTGPRYWYLQRYVTGTIYTHNLFLGGFLHYGMALLFARPFVPSAILTAVAFVVGLFYGYLFVARASGSRTFGLIFLALLATDYYFSLSYAFNLLRGWSWLALFGSAYHALRLAEGSSRRWPHVLGLAAYVLVALGIGYDWSASAAFLTVLVAVCYSRPWHLRAVAMNVGAVLAVWLGWFALRQLQIIGGLGFDFWITDLRYALTVKTSFVATIFGAPTLQEMADYYASKNVLWFGLMIDNNPLNWWPTIVKDWRELWEPHVGTYTLPIVASALVLALAVLAVAPFRKHDACTVVLVRSAGVVLLVAVSIVLGLYVFAYESLIMYLSQRFPLVIAGVLLLYAFAIYAAWWACSRAGGNGAARTLAVAAIMALVGYRALTVYGSLDSLVIVPAPEHVRACLDGKEGHKVTGSPFGC